MKKTFMPAILLYLVWTIPCFAQSIPLSNGATWLSSNQNTDGSWGTQTDLTFMYSSEAINALKSTGTGSANYVTGVNWLALQAAISTDELARQIYSLANNGIDSSRLVSTLLSRRNIDGGWDYKNGPASDPLDTALALQALKAANCTDTTLIGQSLNYLTANQNTDGGWGFLSGESSNAYVTAIVSATLQQFPQTTILATAINKATSYLLAHQNTDGGFGNSPSQVYETALAYKALTNVITDATVLGNAVNYLTTTQAADGSWNQDPYSTALALQALHLSETRPTPPPTVTAGTVSGTVIDASTNQPLNGVTVQWSGSGGQGSASITTSSSGMFSLTNIPQGSQQITFTLIGYATSTATITMTAGSIINIGSVPLSVNPTTGIIQGVVTASASSASLSGVTITITGAYHPDGHDLFRWFLQAD